MWQKESLVDPASRGAYGEPKAPYTWRRDSPFHPEKGIVGLCLFLQPVRGVTGLCRRAYILHPFNRGISRWDYQMIPNRACAEHLNHLHRAVPSTRRKHAAFETRALIRTRFPRPLHVWWTGSQAESLCAVTRNRRSKRKCPTSLVLDCYGADWSCFSIYWRPGNSTSYLRTNPSSQQRIRKVSQVMLLICDHSGRTQGTSLSG